MRSDQGAKNGSKAATQAMLEPNALKSSLEGVVKKMNWAWTHIIPVKHQVC